MHIIDRPIKNLLKCGTGTLVAILLENFEEIYTFPDLKIM